MKRHFSVILAFVFALAACGPTANQLIAEQEYYRVVKEVSMNQRPLVEIEIADPTQPINVKRIAVTLNPLENFKQYVQRDYYGPWLNFAATLVPWAGMYFTAKAWGDLRANETNYNQNVSGGSTATVRTVGNMSFGNLGDGNTIGGVISTPTVGSYNPVTTTSTTTSTTSTADSYNPATTTTTEMAP